MDIIHKFPYNNVQVCSVFTALPNNDKNLVALAVRVVRCVTLHDNVTDWVMLTLFKGSAN